MSDIHPEYINNYQNSLIRRQIIYKNLRKAFEYIQE